MTVYIVMIEDRHTDVEVEVYSDETRAIARGKELAQEYAGAGNEEEYLTTEMVKSGWLYNATYSCEGDSVSVQRKELK